MLILSKKDIVKLMMDKQEKVKLMDALESVHCPPEHQPILLELYNMLLNS